MRLSFIVPSRPGANLTTIKAQIAALDLTGHTAEVFFVEGTLPPQQRNSAIRRTTGEYVFLLDDDLVVPRDLVQKTLPHFDNDRVAVVGGPNLTPPDDPPFAQLSGAVLASRVATGGTSDRWRIGDVDRNATEKKLHGCFLCFRGDLLRRFLFPEDLFPNDENELLCRLRGDGYRLTYVPECFVWHRRRPTLRLHLKQVHISGRGRGELIRRSGLDGQVAYLAPLALLLYAVAAALLARPVRAVVAPAAIYALIAGWFSLDTFARRRRPIFLLAGPLMIASHVVYAIGLVGGLAASKQRTETAVAVEVIEYEAMPGKAARP